MMLGKQITLNDMESVVSKCRSLPWASWAPVPSRASWDHVVVTVIFVGVAIQYEPRGTLACSRSSLSSLVSNK